MIRVWSYQLGKALKLWRLGTYGDRKHWELTIGRVCFYRWCPGAPCHLYGASYQRHWVQLRIWKRREAARTRHRFG